MKVIRLVIISIYVGIFIMGMILAPERINVWVVGIFTLSVVVTVFAALDLIENCRDRG